MPKLKYMQYTSILLMYYNSKSAEFFLAFCRETRIILYGDKKTWQCRPRGPKSPEDSSEYVSSVLSYIYSKYFEVSEY